MRLIRSTIVLVGFSAAVTLAVACGDTADDSVSPLDAGGTPDTGVRETGPDVTTLPPDTGVDAAPIVDATTTDVASADAADASDSSDATTDAKVVDASDASVVDAKAVDASDASTIDASDGSLPEGGNICGGFCGIAKFCCTKITSVDYGKCVGTLGGCQ